VSRQTSINKTEFLKLYNENKTDHEIGALLSVTHDRIRRLRRKLEAIGEIEPRRTREASISKESNNVILSACDNVESMLKDKTDEYRLGFETGARWRLALFGAKTNGRVL
jgi:hypothetical protein